MASIFDLLFGGSQAANPVGSLAPGAAAAVPRPPSILDSPEYGKQRQQDALQGMAMALLQAGGPSAQPRGFMDSIGAAGMGAFQGMQGGEDRFLKRSMVNAQVQKAESERLADDNLNKAIAAGFAQADAPRTAVASAAPSGAPGSYYGTTGGTESGNKDNVPNALGSGAYGRYQFMPDTWAAVATANPQLGLPMNMKQATPQQQQAAMEAFTRANGEGLKKAGFEPSSANLYYAHRFGQKGAETFLGADPNKQIAELFPSWIAQNPDLKTTVGQFRQGVDQRYAGVPSPLATGGGVAPASAPGVPAAAVPTQVAQGGDPVPLQPGVAPGTRGDGSGNPVQPQGTVPGAPQYQAPQMRSLQDVAAAIPPAMRALLPGMSREGKVQMLTKYADPGHEAVLHIPTGQIVYAPKSEIGRNPDLGPVKGAELAIQVGQLDVSRATLANTQRKTDSDLRNADVITDAAGNPIVNQTAVDAKRGVSAAQGTDPAGHIQKALADDAIKRSSEWHKTGMQAQSNLSKLGTVQNLLDQISTNKFKGDTTQIKAAAKAAGFDLDALGVKDDVGPTQAAAALTGLLSLENRTAMPGPMSDGDRVALKNLSASITNDPAGNRILIEVKKADMQRDIDISKYAAEYKRSPAFRENPAGMDDYVESKIAGKNYYDPKLANQSAAPAGALPPPPSSALFDKYGLKPK